MVLNKMTSIPNRISLPLPGRDGTFKLSVKADGATVILNPAANGKLMSIPSHTCSNKEKKWTKMTSPSMTMEEKIG